MEPIRYFDSTEWLAPKCPGCKQNINYQDATFDEKRQSLTCSTCKTPL